MSKQAFFTIQCMSREQSVTSYCHTNKRNIKRINLELNKLIDSMCGKITITFNKSDRLPEIMHYTDYATSEALFQTHPPSIGRHRQKH